MSPSVKLARLSPRPKRILVAEDNPINHKLAVLLLAKLDYQADVAENGAEALKLLEASEYDAVLMDLHMPVMDGFSATRAIRSLSTDRRHVPIIALTAFAIDGARQICLDSGMDDFLTKPIEREKFAAVLAYWTGNLQEERKLIA